MTDPVDRRPSTADQASDAQRPRTPPPFAPIFTLVENASARTTHHPHVRYIFSDDDPDIWTRALAECEESYAPESGSVPASANRAVLLDLTRSDDGGYSVSWASSLSPSWAVLNAQLSQISPPSSEAGHSGGSGEAGPNHSCADRLMLRIEGIETSPVASSSELRRSDEANRTRPGSAAGGGSGGGGGSGQREREEGDDYAYMLDEFEKRMAALRKVVNAGEDRRKKIAAQATATATATAPTTTETETETETETGTGTGTDTAAMEAEDVVAHEVGAEDATPGPQDSMHGSSAK
ncbi:hypothetical protein GGS21DRAFT_445102 [Xylaria nigripes]|nr:hypothetical protein GGS21DRAFT_445102 [Xylaria nigripes]